MRPAARLPVGALLAVLIAGCGLSNPYQSSTRRPPAACPTPTATSTSSTTAADFSDPPGERGGTIPHSAQAAQDKLAAGAAASTPQAALKRYADLDINWQAATVAAHQRQLASISLSQARAQALQAAASAARDPLLTHSQVANHGQLIALTPGTGAAASDWVLVTSEHTTGQDNYAGLPPTLHVTYAQVTHTHRGWVVSQWSPQN